MSKIKVAIIGSGNIGTDLMIKILRLSETLEMSVMVGIDPDSDGLSRARRMDVATTHEGVDGLLKMPEWEDIKVIFDATSAKAHIYNWGKIEPFKDKKIVDLTPAAIGPYLIPAINFDIDDTSKKCKYGYLRWASHYSHSSSCKSCGQSPLWRNSSFYSQ